MAKHKTKVPWRHIRRRFRDLSVEHQRLQRAYRDLEEKWSETEQERIRLTETYEAVPGTSWARDLADVVRERREGYERGEAVTQLIPLVAVGIDPATGTSPNGITVFRSTEDGVTEVINDLKEWGE